MFLRNAGLSAKIMKSLLLVCNLQPEFPGSILDPHIYYTDSDFSRIFPVPPGKYSSTYFTILSSLSLNHVTAHE
jgi:hypothetical protein